MARLTSEQLLAVGNRLEGTCDTVERALDSLDIDADATDVEDQLLDINIEMCQGCGWWDESTMLDGGDTGETGFHEDCAPREETDRG